jgi:hypothetical protein
MPDIQPLWSKGQLGSSFPKANFTTYPLGKNYFLDFRPNNPLRLRLRVTED